MLRLIPAPLHRALLRRAHSVRKRWWRIRKPRTMGCRIIALDDRDRILLIRHSYGSGAWMPPGGGVGRREDPLAAARRELREETGCELAGPALVALVEERLHGAGNSVHVVAGRTLGTLRIDRREVIEAGFFAFDSLPDFMPHMLRGQLREWVEAYLATGG